LGEFTAARTDLEEALAQYHSAHKLFYAEMLSYDLLVAFLCHFSQVLVCLGDLDQALSQRDAALQEARRLSHPHDVAIALGFAWLTDWCVGADPKSLSQCADELLALSNEHGLGFYRALALLFRGWCLAALGQTDETIPLLGTGLAGVDDVGFML